jgi:hypothetical protein
MAPIFSGVMLSGRPSTLTTGIAEPCVTMPAMEGSRGRHEATIRGKRRTPGKAPQDRKDSMTAWPKLIAMP